jgi:serine/threonine protein kinase
MGEVYRASDTRLKRDVAIDVLPAALTADPERLARFEREAQLLATRWYDSGMTASKIAITLPPDQLARVRQAVRRGRASSVSAYIAKALAEQDREESLADLLRDLVAQHGEPTAEERRWARRVVGRRSRG